MIVVIQCAGRKPSDAGHLVSAAGKPVIFVADPDSAPINGAFAYARPDEPSDNGTSWRECCRAGPAERGVESHQQWKAKSIVGP